MATESTKKKRISFRLRKRQYPVLPWDRSKPYFISRRPLIILLLLALVGVFATAFLTYRHIVLTSHTGNVGESALCKAQGVINCDGILLTDYSVLLGYFPSSVLGLMGFVFVWWLLVNSLLNERVRKLAMTLLVLYFFMAIGFSWYYIYLMAFEVDYVCTWCIVVHVINFTSLALILYFSIKNRQNFLLEEPASKWERFYFIAGGLCLALVVFFGSVYLENYLSFRDAKTKYEELANDPVVIMATVKASPDYEIPITKDDPVFGNPSAPFPIVLFSDFQCPVCSQTEQYLKSIVNANPHVLSLVYKNYPLSPNCNSIIIGNLHPYACEAAKAAYAAFILKDSTGFWQYGDLLFANQREFKKQPWLQYANMIGLDVNRFTQLMQANEKPELKIKEDTELGATLKLTATPQIFFLSKNVPQSFKGEFLLDTLEELVKWKYPENSSFKLRKP